MKVTLKITNSSGFSTLKEVEVEPESTIAKTQKKAQLKFLNEYINRDFDIGANYESLKEAKERAGIKCKPV